MTLHGLDAIKEQDIEGILRTFKQKGLEHRSIRHLLSLPPFVNSMISLHQTILILTLFTKPTVIIAISVFYSGYWS